MYDKRLGSGSFGDCYKGYLGRPPAAIKKMRVGLIDEEGFGARARELGEAIGRSDGPLVSARLIERLVETREPLVRPQGYPQTIERDAPLPWEQGAQA